MGRPQGGKEIPPTTRAALLMATECIGLQAAARKLGLSPNTAKATVKRVRAIAQKHNRDLYDPENFASNCRTGAPEALSEEDKEALYAYVRASDENAQKPWTDVARACNISVSKPTLRRAFVKGGFERVDGWTREKPRKDVGPIAATAETAETPDADAEASEHMEDV